MCMTYSQMAIIRNASLEGFRKIEPLRTVHRISSTVGVARLGVDFRRGERSEILDNSAKLSDPQEHPVALEVRDGHSWQT